MNTTENDIYEIGAKLYKIFKSISRRTIVDTAQRLARNNPKWFGDELQCEVESLIIKSLKLPCQVKYIADNIFEVYLDGDVRRIHKDLASWDYWNISPEFFVNSRRIRGLMIRSKMDERIAVG